MDSINFKAAYLDNAFVLAKTGKDNFIHKEVALLKINLKSENDRKALTDICSKWEKKNTLIRFVLNSMDSKPSKKRNIYVLSDQEDNYNKLLPEKILGIAEVSDFKEMRTINYIQTNPKYEYTNEKRKIKGVGYAMLDYITHKAGKRKTYLDAFSKVVNFYKKFGFEISRPSDYMPLMVYNPKNKG